MTVFYKRVHQYILIQNTCSIVKNLFTKSCDQWKDKCTCKENKMWNNVGEQHLFILQTPMKNQVSVGAKTWLIIMHNNETNIITKISSHVKITSFLRKWKDHCAMVI